MTEAVDWGPIRALARRVLTEGERLALTRKETALLKRTAAEMGISDSEAESALTTEEAALGLLREETRRIRDGTRRLMDALHRMYQHKDKGDFVSARQEMRDVLAVEVVPHYRALAQGQLDAMANEAQRRARRAVKQRCAGQRRHSRLRGTCRRSALRRGRFAAQTQVGVTLSKGRTTDFPSETRPTVTVFAFSSTAFTFAVKAPRPCL